MEIIPLLVSMLLLMSSEPILTQAQVQLTGTNTATGTPGGMRFDREIGLQYSLKVVSDATNFIWQTFRQGAADRKPVNSVDLFIGDIDGVAYTSGNQIHVSARYIAAYGGDLRREITGILYHETTHVWQWDGKGQAPGWVIEGVADYIRLKAGLAPAHWRKAGEGNSWTDSYDITARFFDYCNGLKDGFVAELNGKMKDGYNDQLFADILGKPLKQLWSDYKAAPRS
ncbi:Basic secretory protease [Nymphaea thermarum]|nr:Basic secretory protease [Nymphaea thermarum]